MALKLHTGPLLFSFVPISFSFSIEFQLLPNSGSQISNFFTNRVESLLQLTEMNHSGYFIELKKFLMLDASAEPNFHNLLL